MLVEDNNSYAASRCKKITNPVFPWLGDDSSLSVAPCWRALMLPSLGEDINLTVALARRVWISLFRGWRGWYPKCCSLLEDDNICVDLRWESMTASVLPGIYSDSHIAPCQGNKATPVFFFPYWEKMAILICILSLERTTTSMLPLVVEGEDSDLCVLHRKKRIAVPEFLFAWGERNFRIAPWWEEDRTFEVLHADRRYQILCSSFMSKENNPWVLLAGEDNNSGTIICLEGILVTPYWKDDNSCNASCWDNMLLPTETWHHLPPTLPVNWSISCYSSGDTLF